MDKTWRQLFAGVAAGTCSNGIRDAPAELSPADGAGRRRAIHASAAGCRYLDDRDPARTHRGAADPLALSLFETARRLCARVGIREEARVRHVGCTSAGGHHSVELALVFHRETRSVQATGLRAVAGAGHRARLEMAVHLSAGGHRDGWRARSSGRAAGGADADNRYRDAELADCPVDGTDLRDAGDGNEAQFLCNPHRPSRRRKHPVQWQRIRTPEILGSSTRTGRLCGMGRAITKRPHTR